MGYGIGTPSLYESMLGAYYRGLPSSQQFDLDNGPPAEAALPPGQLRVGIPQTTPPDQGQGGDLTQILPPTSGPNTQGLPTVSVGVPPASDAVPPPARVATIEGMPTPGTVIYHGMGLQNAEFFNPTDEQRSRLHLTDTNPAVPLMFGPNLERSKLELAQQVAARQAEIAERDSRSLEAMRQAQAEAARAAATVSTAEKASLLTPEGQQTQRLLEIGRQNPTIWQTPEFKQKVGIPLTTQERVAVLQSENPLLDVAGGLTQIREGYAPGTPGIVRFFDASRFGMEPLTPEQKVAQALANTPAAQEAQWRKIAEAAGLIPPVAILPPKKAK